MENYIFVLSSFDGKNTKKQAYKTLKGIEKRIGATIANAKEPIFTGSNIVYEGTEGTNKITVFRELK